MEMEINGKTYHFKEKCTMMDYIASFSSKIQIGWRSQVALLARMSQEPTKLKAKDLLLMDASAVIGMIRAISNKYGMTGDYDFLENE